MESKPVASHAQRSIDCADASPFHRSAVAAALDVAVRIIFAIVVILTCFYCLLTYIPFTYYAVI
ncbi:MAG TPA: hypothetical protein VG897_16565, partial [Terriglobales bacterium]|nr:hypothetical protein [Terriglobales bacterium]